MRCVCHEGRSKAVLSVTLPPDRLLTLADTLKPRAIITKCTLAHCVLCACALEREGWIDSALWWRSEGGGGTRTKTQAWVDVKALMVFKCVYLNAA